MAGEEVVLAPEAIPDLIKLAGSLSRWLQALGGLFIIIVLSNILNIILNRKKLKKVIALQNELEKVEDRLDRVLKRKNYQRRRLTRKSVTETLKPEIE